MKSFFKSYDLLQQRFVPSELDGVPRIVAIEMEHFQSFKEPTRIELNGLTMLFGPNSAGKSAVIDAQSMLSEFWDCERISSDTLNTMFHRWARDDRETQKKQVKWLKLAVELDLGGIVLGKGFAVSRKRKSNVTISYISKENHAEQFTLYHDIVKKNIKIVEHSIEVSGIA